MLHRFAVAITIVFFLAGCVEPVDEIGDDEECPEFCPFGMVAVDQCPAFSNCEKYPGCEDPAICAPREDLNDQNQEDFGSGDPDCEDPVRCPPGSTAVDACPDGELCTTISLCQTTVICKEVEGWCKEQPYCPDDHRAVESCEDLDEEFCSIRNHCSGPVRCLECHDDLPEECPEDHERVDAEDCDDEELDCERVETCDETLWCVAEEEEEPDEDPDDGDENEDANDGEPDVECLDVESCPEATIEVDNCDDIERDCVEMEVCEGSLACAAPEEECYEVVEPACDDGYESVDAQACFEHVDECVAEVSCGMMEMCLES